MIHLALALLLAQDSYKTEKTADAVVVSSAGKEMLRYQFQKPADSKLAVESACYFHPLTTPVGHVVTDVAPSDHKHHRGIFLAWFEMLGKKGADFWGWGQFAPVKDRIILNREARDLNSGDAALFNVRNDWMAEDLRLVKEELYVCFVRERSANILDLQYTLTADGDVKLPQRAFSGFCARLRKDGKATIESPEGEVKLPAPHHLKPESDWPAQPWYAFQITLPDGPQVGCAVIDGPKNPKSLWHNPASIRMLNPCIIAPGEVVLKAGEPLRLHYQVVAWDGPTPR